jgi:hypothetical protein
METVFPSEVFEAIKYAKSIDNTDIHGDGAFNINTDRIREAKQNTRYLQFKILKKRIARDGSSKWEFIPLALKVMNIATRSHIKPKESKTNFPGVRLQFSRTTKSVRQTKQNDAIIDIDEDYGLAIIAIYAAFSRMMKKIIDSRTIYHDKTEIKSIIQSQYKVDTKTGKKAPCAEEIIRVEVPFESESQANIKVIKPDALPMCEIFDASKRNAQKSAGACPFEHATWEDKPINYTTINEFINPGSLCSGTNTMDSVCLSSQGISLPCKFTLLIVKRYKPVYRPVADKLFNADEFAEIAGPDDNTDEPAPDSNDEANNKINAAIEAGEVNLTNFGNDDEKSSE